VFRKRARGWIYAAILLGVAGALMPLAWLFLISLRGSLAAAGQTLWLANYADVLFQTLLPYYFLNSAMVAALTSVWTLCFACLGAYAASRYRFRFKTSIMLVLLGASLIPVIAVIVPLYTYAAALKLLNTYTVLVVALTACQLPGTLWLMQSYLNQVPVEIEEAALVDGCSRFGAFVRVLLPQLTPALVGVGFIVFVHIWNEFLVAVSLSSRQGMRTISVGLYFFMSESGVDWGHIAAGAMLSLVPPAVLFLVLQRQLLHGLSAGQ
jgi:ABC-type glycerol-3-phosphate transport system permease component